jgi:hypothetical protein
LIDSFIKNATIQTWMVEKSYNLRNLLSGRRNSSMTDLLEFKYEGFLALRKDDVVKITWAFPVEHELHPRDITRIINETAQVEYRSPRETAASSPLDKPITDKVVSSAVGGSSTSSTSSRCKIKLLGGRKWVQVRRK